MNSMHRLLRGKGAQLLYLDFDGVLHHDSVYRHPRRGIYIDAPGDFVLFQHAQLLDEALASYPNVQIILSTSWVRGLGFSRARRRLPHSLRSRVIGATFHTFMDAGRFAAMPRGVQIVGDVRRRQPAVWLALDNDAEGWPQEEIDRLILSDDVHGISPESVLATMEQKFRATYGEFS